MKYKLLILTLIISKIVCSQCGVILEETGCADDCQGSVFVHNSVGAEPFTYLWSNDQTTNTATDLCVDSTYWVKYTDANNCSDTAYITMPSTMTINIISVTDATCPNCCDGAIQFSTGEPGCSPYYLYIIDSDNYTINAMDFNSLCIGLYQACIQDACGCTSCSPMTIEIVSGVNPNNSLVKTSFFPNPSNGKITIQTSEKEYEVIMLDMSGKVLMYEKNAKIIDLENYSAGKYILKLKGKNKSEQQSIIVY